MAKKRTPSPPIMQQGPRVEAFCVIRGRGGLDENPLVRRRGRQAAENVVAQRRRPAGRGRSPSNPSLPRHGMLADDPLLSLSSFFCLTALGWRVARWQEIVQRSLSEQSREQKGTQQVTIPRSSLPSQRSPASLTPVWSAVAGEQFRPAVTLWCASRCIFEAARYWCSPAPLAALLCAKSSHF